MRLPHCPSWSEPPPSSIQPSSQVLLTHSALALAAPCTLPRMLASSADVSRARSCHSLPLPAATAPCRRLDRTKATSLQTLWLSGNKLSDISATIAQVIMQAISLYLPLSFPSDRRIVNHRAAPDAARSQGAAHARDGQEQGADAKQLNGFALLQHRTGGREAKPQRGDQSSESELHRRRGGICLSSPLSTFRTDSHVLVQCCAICIYNLNLVSLCLSSTTPLTAVQSCGVLFWSGTYQNYNLKIDFARSHSTRRHSTRLGSRSLGDTRRAREPPRGEARGMARGAC